MRELKFRAWDKQKEEMLYKGFILVPTTPNWSASIDRGSIELETWYDKFLLEQQGELLGSGGIWIGEGSDYYASDNLAIMQFTGLADKNGVEIFEGDIVIWKLRDKIPEEVYYNEEECAFFSRPQEDTESWLDNTCEVVGNIYENPELLK